MQRRILASAVLLVGLAGAAHAQAPAAKPLPPIVEKSVATVQGARTLSVDVVQVVPPGSASDTAHLVFARPNKIKVVSKIGDKTVSTLVCDGKTLYQWNSKQYIKKDAPATLADVEPPLPMGLAANIAGPLLANTREMARELRLTDAGTTTILGVPAHRLAPQSAGEGAPKLTLWLADATGLPLQLKLESGTRALTLAFKNYALNKAVAENTFSATPPQGLVAYSPPEQPELLKPGTAAPDFTLSTPDGKSVSLSSLKGRPVLIDFWASWCGPCKMAMPHIQKLHEELGDKVTVLSVNSWDKQADMQTFLKANPQYTTTILFDPNDGPQSVAMSKYKVTGIPTVYVIDKDGNVAASFVGYDPDGESQIRAALTKLGVQ